MLLLYLKYNLDAFKEKTNLYVEAVMSFVNAVLKFLTYRQELVMMTSKNFYIFLIQYSHLFWKF